MVRESLGVDRYRAENARLREAGRLLSGAREADVRLETLERLCDRYRARRPEALGPLAAELAAARGSNGAGSERRLREARRQATALIELARDSTALDLDRTGWALLRGGLERAYRGGRRGHRRVVAEPEPEGVHEWRKRVKDLWYHLRLLHNSGPVVVGAFTE